MVSSSQAPDAPGEEGVALSTLALSRGNVAPAASEARALEMALQGEPTPHPSPGQAPLAQLRAQLQEARRRRDRAEESAAAATLARALAARPSELDTALLLARRALTLREDPQMREDLASWLLGMGEHVAVATELRKGLEGASGADAVEGWARVGDALARAGDAAGAADALRSALAHDPQSSVLHEVLGALSFWAPEQVRPEVGAAAFLDASRIRLRTNDLDGAMEDRLRALEVAPGLEVAEAVAELLAARGRGAAGDEVVRGASERLGREATAVHRVRMRKALEERDVARALGAALDGAFDERGGDDGAAFDVLLDLSGLHDLLVARMQLRAEVSAGEVRAELYADLGRLLGGPLDRPQQAAQAWAHVLEESPGHEEATEALRVLGVSREAALAGPSEAEARARVASSEPAEMAALRLVLCAAARRRGDRREALREVLQILEVLPAHREALALTAALGALGGNALAKIEALAALSVGLTPDVRATVLAWAARAVEAQGDPERARQLAERAHHADPSLPRAAGTLAALLMGARDRVAAAALERAAALTAPTGALCAALSQTHEALEQPQLALRWTQRLAALRPGDPVVAASMLRLAVAGGDASRLEEAIEWVAALGAPLTPVGEALGTAMRTLAALDLARGGAAARKALDAHGPVAPALRLALLDVIEATDDATLAAALWERWAAGACPPAERAAAWLGAAQAHQQRGDVVALARALSRALKDGAAASDVLVRLDGVSSDEPEGALGLMEVKAEALAGLGASRSSEAAALWREIGAARCDWAADRAGMVRAWVRAAELEPIQGPARLVRDLFAFAGPTQALQELLLYAEQKKSPRESAHVLSLAALAALLAGETRRAFDTAERAMLLDPYRAEALAVAERAADVALDLDRLSALYGALAASAKGKFGRRAAHYRAARTLEAWGLTERASRHAIQAFEQVPSLGTPFALMMRLTARAGLAPLAVETLCQVAAAAPTSNERWTWLLHAADACGDDEAGRRLRADVLMRAVRERPDRRTVDSAADALAVLIQTLHEPHEQILARWLEAQNALLRRLDGPDGARVAVSFALASLRAFGVGAPALSALRRALETDADIDEYAGILPFAGLLAEAEMSDPESRVVERCRALLRQPFANVGTASLRLCIHVARLRRDREAAFELLQRAAKRFDDDEGIIAEAEATMSVFADDELRQTLLKLYPTATPPPPSAVASGPAAPDPRAQVSGEVREAREAGDLAALAAALGRLAELETEPGARRQVLRELAPLLSELGQGDGARAAWGALLDSDPNDREALQALEQIAMDSGDYASLATILRRRCELSSDPEEMRVLRLRRAALLEQRLGRIDEARAELESLLEQQADDPSATRFLADLLERQGNFIAAGGFWLRAFRHQVDPRDRTDLAVRAAHSFVKGGDLDQARSALDAALLISRSERLLELRVDIERASGNPRGLADALDELAIASMAAAERRAELLLEATHASMAAGDDAAALERAQRAARIAPHAPAAQLLARLLEYRARGAGTPQEAAQTIDELRRIAGIVPPTQVPLHAFLLAEALDALQGGNAGMRELSARHAEIGAPPLIALGMAERLARTSNFQAALPFFDAALAGDLHEVRRHGVVALAAADAAQRLDDLDRAAAYFQDATRDPTTAATARQRLAALEQLRQHRVAALASDPRRALQELALHAVGLERARLLAQIARLTAPIQGERAEADRLFTEAITAAYLDPALRMELEAERDVFRGVTRPSSRPPALTQAPEAAPAAAPAVRASNPAIGPALSSPPLNLPPPPEPRIEAPPASITAPPASIAAVSTSAPPTVRISTSSPALVPDAAPLSGVVVTEKPPEVDRITLVPAAEIEHRQRFLLDPSNPEPLRAMREVALADHNPTYARALEHIVNLYTPGATPVAPPPLSAQREEPDAVHQLIARGVGGAAAEALALVWEHASQLFRRDAGTYGVTGLDRVALSGNTVACRVYAQTTRMLDTSRTPLFQRRSHGPVTTSVALLVPPAVILAGDPRDETPELLFRLGASFASVWPEHALVFGLQEAQLRSLLAALVSAFGPPPTGPVASSSIAALAGSLWQALPARAQRRMSELCVNAHEFSIERTLSAARRVSHRAGLFLCGDLGVAVNETIQDEKLALDRPLDSFAALAAACERHPQLLDLLSLAVSPEYADARWRPGERLRRPPSGAFRVGS